MKEFAKLERIEIGGLKGRVLSSRIISIHKEFIEQFTLFSMKSYDVLNPEDRNLLDDCETFRQVVDELDHRLATILCQAFDECSNTESVFKVSIIYIYIKKNNLQLFICSQRCIYILNRCHTYDKKNLVVFVFFCQIVPKTDPREI